MWHQIKKINNIYKNVFYRGLLDNQELQKITEVLEDNDEIRKHAFGVCYGWLILFKMEMLIAH